VNITDDCKGSARGNAASNGKRIFHKRKIGWVELKKRMAGEEKIFQGCIWSRGAEAPPLRVGNGFLPSGGNGRSRKVGQRGILDVCFESGQGDGVEAEMESWFW
jgi:hypothetical protein